MTNKSLKKSKLFEDGLEKAVALHLSKEVYFIKPDKFLLKPSYGKNTAR